MICSMNCKELDRGLVHNFCWELERWSKNTLGREMLYYVNSVDGGKIITGL